METTQAETCGTEFTPAQRHTLGRLYGFLMELGRKRLKRLEQESNKADAKQNGKPPDCSAMEMENMNQESLTN